MPVYSQPPPDWDFPAYLDELAKLIEDQFKDALSNTYAEKVLDPQFNKTLETFMGLKDEDFIEEDMRKFIAKHQTP